MAEAAAAAPSARALVVCASASRRLCSGSCVMKSAVGSVASGEEPRLHMEDAARPAAEESIDADDAECISSIRPRSCASSQPCGPIGTSPPPSRAICSCSLRWCDIAHARRDCSWRRNWSSSCTYPRHEYSCEQRDARVEEDEVEAIACADRVDESAAIDAAAGGVCVGASAA